MPLNIRRCKQYLIVARMILKSVAVSGVKEGGYKGSANKLCALLVCGSCENLICSQFILVDENMRKYNVMKRRIIHVYSQVVLVSEFY